MWTECNGNKKVILYTWNPKKRRRNKITDHSTRPTITVPPTKTAKTNDDNKQSDDTIDYYMHIVYK